MKKIFQLLLLSSLLILFTNCEKEFFGNKNCTNIDGPVVTQTLNLPDIHSFDIELPVELILKEGDTQEVILESSQILIDEILAASQTNNGEWTIDLTGCYDSNQSIFGDYVVRITATIASLQQIKIKSHSKLSTDGVFRNITDLKLEVEGIADVDFKTDTIQSLETKIKGSGDIILSGVAENYLLEIQGSSTVQAFDLITQDCEIKIEGTGECEITALETLDIKISGTGNVCYKGQPTLNIDNQGGGGVKSCN